MGTVATSLTSWEEFLLLPDAGNGERYELHDGEVFLLPPPSPIHVYIQILLAQWLMEAAKGQGRAAQEFPYRPAKNLQFWYADVAYIPNEDGKAMRADQYPIYSPPLVIEILSPSNRAKEVNRRRIAAFSGGTQEFWVIDPDTKTVEVSAPGLLTRVFGVDGVVPVSVLAGVLFPVSILFEE
jgi:Uma2 family endonuclease